MSQEEVAKLLQTHERQLRQMASYYYKARLASHIEAVCWSREDLYQEAQLRALKHAQKFEPTNFLGWMHVITRNLASNILNAARKREGLREPYLKAPLLPDEELARKERAIALYLAIDKLPVRQGVLALDALSQQNTKDRAEDLGISYTNMKVGLHEAKHSLKRALKDYNPYDV